MGYKNVRRINENFKGKYEQSPSEYREHHSKHNPSFENCHLLIQLQYPQASFLQHRLGKVHLLVVQVSSLILSLAHFNASKLLLENKNREQFLIISLLYGAILLI